MLRTHSHADHVLHEEELDLPVVTSSFEIDGLSVEAIPTPGHSDDMVCFVVRDEIGEEYVFSGDTLFKNSIGGGNFEQIKTAVMDVYMEMPKTRLLMPGHTDLTTIAARVGAESVHPRVARRGSRGHRGRDGRRTRRDPDRLERRLRRQGQGVGPLRRRRGRDRRRLVASSARDRRLRPVRKGR